MATKTKDPIDTAVSAIEKQITELEAKIQPDRDLIAEAQARMADTEQTIERLRDSIDVMTGTKNVRSPIPPARRTRSASSIDLEALKRLVGDATASGATASELAEQLDVDSATVGRALKKLVDDEAIVKAGQRRGTRYWGKPWEKDAEAHDKAQAA